MLNRSSTTVLALLFLVLELATSAAAQSTATNPQTATTPTAPGYPESPQGLSALFKDIFAAEKAQDTAKATQLFDSLTIPDHAQWFTTTFGDSEGPRLDAKYTSTTEPPWQTLRQRVTWSLAQHKTIVHIEILLRPQGIPQPFQSLIEQMRIAIPLYHVSSMDSSGDATLYPLGDFVYADDSFRYIDTIDTKVMHALSTVPPRRVRIAPEIQNKQLVNYVQPRYPDDVHIGGTVKLHILVGKDGTVMHIDVISGNPMLLPAAMDAVKSWRYRPTLLNGETVEVDTEADVVFQLLPPK